MKLNQVEYLGHDKKITWKRILKVIFLILLPQHIHLDHNDDDDNVKWRIIFYNRHTTAAWGSGEVKKGNLRAFNIKLSDNKCQRC